MAVRRLGDILLSAGIITEDDLQFALNKQKETKERFGAVLISSGIITERQLIECLQLQLGVDYIDLSKTRIPISLAQAVPKNIASQYDVVPVRIEKDSLYLAMSDPLNFYAIEEVRKVSGKKVIPMIALSSELKHAIMVLYGNEGAAKAIEEMKKEIPGVAEDEGFNVFVSNKITDDVNDAPTIRLVNSIIERAANESASDIHIEPMENELQVRMRIDGIMRIVLNIPKKLQNSVISRLKVMGGMNIAERRIPQDGRCNVMVDQEIFDLRISTLPTIFGEKIVVRLLNKSSGILSVEKIGLEGKNREMFYSMLKNTSGVILIVGPTGSGKSSTMNVIISELNTEEVNIVTLEDPVEYNIEGVNQVQINEKTGMTFANGLRAILRQDPDIISLGEIRDGETADICMRAAITGHLVLSTVHTNDALGVFERLKDIGVESYLISSALKGIVSQRLVRKICPKCKKSYTPDTSEYMQLKLDASTVPVLYKGTGCSECYNTGYRGRIGVFELLVVTEDLKHMIASGCKREDLMEALTKDGRQYKTIWDNGLELVTQGITSAEEFLRVVQHV